MKRKGHWIEHGSNPIAKRVTTTTSLKVKRIKRSRKKKNAND